METPEFSYTNEDALEDGIFTDVTPDSMKEKGWKWIATATVATEFSKAAIAELFNEMADYYNRTKDTMTTGKMNGKELFLMLEGGENGEKVFKFCFPEEY